MKQQTIWKWIIFIAVIHTVFTPSGYGAIGETTAMIGEGIVEFPTSLIKIVGGTLKLIGEIIILPFQAL